MPNDPSNPKPPSPYQTTSTTTNKGGGGGIFFVILLVLVLGGGGAYYFLYAKPAADKIPAPTPTPTASATPKPSVAPKAPTEPYTKEQRKQYIQTAIDGFKAMRASKYQPFADAFAAFSAAGGLSAATLTSKDAIAARHEMIQKCLAANDDYTAFIKDQEAAYTAELKKTPLVPNDVEVESSYTGAKMPTDKIVQLRTLQGESLKTGDQMIEYLGSKFGAWSINADKHLIFKKAADSGPFSALAKTYGEQVAALNKLRDEVNANPDATEPTASSTATTGAASPAPAASAGAVSPAPSASVMPTATASPTAQ